MREPSALRSQSSNCSCPLWIAPPRPNRRTRRWHLVLPSCIDVGVARRTDRIDRAPSAGRTVPPRRGTEGESRASTLISTELGRAKAAPEIRHVMVEDAELKLLNQAIGKRGRDNAAQCGHQAKTSDEVSCSHRSRPPPQAKDHPERSGDARRSDTCFVRSQAKPRRQDGRRIGRRGHRILSRRCSGFAEQLGSDWSDWREFSLLDSIMRDVYALARRRR